MSNKENGWVEWICPYCDTVNWDNPSLTSAPMCSGQPDCPNPYDFDWDVVFENELESVNE